MKKLLLLLVLLPPLRLLAQTDSVQATREIMAFQQKHTAEYKDPKESPLEPQALKSFKGHDFFPVALKYRVQARFVRTPNEQPFLMPTTTERRPEYVKYGEAHFTLDGKPYQLNLYQNLSLAKKPEYKDYLFLPFTDLTNGHSSYGGGRFLDLRIPAGETILIDFNQAYNPYCAYNHKYSCPIPPRENHLDTQIEAGLQFKGH